MHELSIAMSIVEAVSEEASHHGSVTVSAVHVRVGPLSGVVVEALESAFELAREGSVVAEAALVVESVPLVGHCERCGDARSVRSIQARCCDVCETPIRRIVSGEELQITAMEIKT